MIAVSRINIKLSATRVFYSLSGAVYAEDYKPAQTVCQTFGSKKINVLYYFIPYAFSRSESAFISPPVCAAINSRHSKYACISPAKKSESSPLSVLSSAISSKLYSIYSVRFFNKVSASEFFISAGSVKLLYIYCNTFLKIIISLFPAFFDKIRLDFFSFFHFFSVFFSFFQPLQKTRFKIYRNFTNLHFKGIFILWI